MTGLDVVNWERVAAKGFLTLVLWAGLAKN